MARPRKNDSSTLVEIVDDYYTTEAKGDIRKIKYSRLAKHAESKGIKAAWYDFQRDPSVLQRIRELTELESRNSEETIVPAYKSLDIDALLNHCGTAEELKQKLFELDQYWKKIYDEAIRIAAEDCSLVGKQQEYELDKKNLSQKLKETETKARKLEQENVYLRRMLRDNLYPTVANELLRQTNLPVPENETVRKNAMADLIEGNFPKPIEGAHRAKQKKMTKQEQLLADMQAQVKKHGR